MFGRVNIFKNNSGLTNFTPINQSSINQSINQSINKTLIRL